MSRSKDLELNFNESGFERTKIVYLLLMSDFIFSSDLPSLIEKSSTQTWRFVKSLKGDGLAETRTINGRKYLLLTDEAVKKFKSSRDDTYLIHSLYTSNFLAALKKFLPNVSFGWGRELEKEKIKMISKEVNIIIPDAYFYLETNCKFALEIELTQKSETKIISKIDRYLLGGHSYDRVLYFFRDERLLKKFQGLINQRKKAMKDRSVKYNTEYGDNLFVLTYSQTPFKFDDTMPYLMGYEGKEWSRDKILNIVKEGNSYGSN